MKTTTSFMYKQIAFAIKCLFFGAIIALSFNSNLFAQKRIVRQNLGVATFYSDFSVMIAALQTGDTIYFPGAGYSIGDWAITKKVTIFGAGHYPDSTVATGTTALTGNIILKTGADGTIIQGVYMINGNAYDQGNIFFGTGPSDQNVHDVTISRCNVVNIRLSYNGSATTPSDNITIRDNVICNVLQGGYATGVLVANNIICQQISYFSNTLFINNIQLGNYTGSNYYPTGPLLYINNSTFNNNVMGQGFGGVNYFMSNCNSNTFQKNTFTKSEAEINAAAGTNTFLGCWYSILPSATFELQSGTSFSYSHNYHLKTAALAIYIGTDGTQIGIYGSSIPYKDGAVPINPHIRTKTIAPTTDCNGLLNIDIKVAAQNN